MTAAFLFLDECMGNGAGSKFSKLFDPAAPWRWHHGFEVEAIHGERFTTREQAREQVLEYMEVYYNRGRLHSTPGYPSPVGFEHRMVA